MEGIPILTLTMQGMRHSMMQALVAHHDEIQKICDEQFKAFIDNGEIETTIKQEFNRLLKATLADALRDAVHKAIWSQDVKKILHAEVHTSLLKVLREYYPGSEPDPEEGEKV